jgi:NAD-dependent dihydropyrimidine dehydrogenase PreA subunit
MMYEILTSEIPFRGESAIQLMYRRLSEAPNVPRPSAGGPTSDLCFPVFLCYVGTGKTTAMAYVIAEPCIGTKDTACVDACPVDCIHPKKDEAGFAAAEMLYIDPVECIDCGACVPVCPVSAIFALDDLPEKWNEFTAKNAAYYGK